MPHDDALLLDIARAARLAQDFVTGIIREQFLVDLKTQSAVLHQLLILGEAAKKLSPGARASYSRVPWKLIAGMRDKLIHGYNEVDLEVVWRSVESDVPKLLAELDRPPS